MRAWILLLGVMAWSPMTYAQVPPLIRYQGTLVDAQNVPLEGAHTLTFRLYPAAIGGSAVWTEAQTSVPISRGVFNVLLGQVVPLTVAFEKEYWLSVQVDADGEMSPRQQLTSVPYAVRAAVAERLAEEPAHFAIDSQRTLANGLVAYWSLDESEGTRNDQLGPNDLTDRNAVTQSAGKKANAAQFAAANSKYLSMADNAAMSVGNLDFTWAGWFYLDSHPPAGSDMPLVSKGILGETGREAYSIKVQRNGANTESKMVFIVGSGPWSHGRLNSEVLLSTGTWYFFAAVHDSANDQLRLMINGSTETIPWSGGGHDEACELMIGAMSAHGGSVCREPTTYLNGRIDEVGFWKRVLTPQECADLYNAGDGNAYQLGGFFMDSLLTGKRYRLLMEELP